MAKYIRLKSMVEIISNVTVQGEEVTLHKPLEATFEINGVKTAMIAIYPFIENNLTDVTDVTIARSDILWMVDPKKELDELYDNYCDKVYAPRPAPVPVKSKKAEIHSLADYMDRDPSKKN